MSQELAIVFKTKFTPDIIISGWTNSIGVKPGQNLVIDASQTNLINSDIQMPIKYRWFCPDVSPGCASSIDTKWTQPYSLSFDYMVQYTYKLQLSTSIALQGKLPYVVK
jgi:hypothetical protein